jgi:hypothetical protein
MSRKRYLISRRLWAGMLATAVICALTGCRSVTTAPADTRLAGQWSLDKAASDDASAKVAATINTAQQRLRRRNADRYGMGSDSPPSPPGNNGPSGAEGGPDESFDTPGDRYGGPGMLGPDFRTLRARLQQALLAPAALHLEVQGELVRVTSDQLPAREYRLGERISRFDEYGTSVIDATWSHGAFVLRSSYTSHASRTERYEVDASTGVLTVTQQISDPTVGKIAVRSVYRRS